MVAIISKAGKTGSAESERYGSATFFARSIAASSGCSPKAPKAGSSGDPYNATNRYLFASTRPPAGNAYSLGGLSRDGTGRRCGAGGESPGLKDGAPSAHPPYIPAPIHNTTIIPKIVILSAGRPAIFSAIFFSIPAPL